MVDGLFEGYLIDCEQEGPRKASLRVCLQGHVVREIISITPPITQSAPCSPPAATSVGPPRRRLLDTLVCAYNPLRLSRQQFAGSTHWWPIAPPELASGRWRTWRLFDSGEPTTGGTCTLKVQHRPMPQAFAGRSDISNLLHHQRAPHQGLSTRSTSSPFSSLEVP